MVVEWDEHNDKKGLPHRYPMTILLKPINEKSDLKRASNMAQHILLSFLPSESFYNVRIREDGSRFRLVYDISASYQGNHRPINSTSSAVRVCLDGKICFLTILELPRTINRVNKIFHGHFLSEAQVVMKVKSLTECTIKVVGDDFGTKTIFCEPYCIVSGEQWKQVDQAAEILRIEIQRHQQSCACSY